jgi:hypothetical protein
MLLLGKARKMIENWQEIYVRSRNSDLFSTEIWHNNSLSRCSLQFSLNYERDGKECNYSNACSRRRWEIIQASRQQFRVLPVAARIPQSICLPSQKQCLPLDTNNRSNNFKDFKIMAPLKITFVTGNKHKATDVQYILGDAVDLEIADYDTPELQGTVEEIAIDKCRRAAEAVRYKSERDLSTSNFLSLVSL